MAHSYESHLFYHILSLSGPMALKCVIELDIPDIIHRHGEPLPLSDLIALLSIPGAKASHVRRLMRLLAHMGYFEVHKVKDGEDAYSLTAAKIFLKDNPTNQAAWVVGVLSPLMMSPWQMMSAWFRQDSRRSPFEMSHGKSRHQHLLIDFSFFYVTRFPIIFRLQYILHDWNHEDCVEIMKKCKEAIPSREEGGKVIIVDIVVNAPGDDSSTTDTKLWWDIKMSLYVEGGAEREESEWKKIFEDAGYSGYKINPLGIRSLIEVFP